MKKTPVNSPRLNLLNTHWSEIILAHDDTSSISRIAIAKQNVIERYHDCIYHYLLGATRDPNVAEELAQEFSLRFVRGDFRKVDPSKGRFRDYLKTVLRNLVNDHYRQRKKHAAVPLEFHEPLAKAGPLDDLELEFAELWRQSLIAQAWEALAELEQRKSNAYHTVLRFRADHPDLNSAESAIELSEIIGQKVTADWFRQNLHRAREKFGQYLLTAVKQTLPVDLPTAIEDELADLRLLKYVDLHKQSS